MSVLKESHIRKFNRYPITGELLMQSKFGKELFMEKHAYSHEYHVELHRRILCSVPRCHHRDHVLTTDSRTCTRNADAIQVDWTGRHQRRKGVIEVWHPRLHSELMHAKN